MNDSIRVSNLCKDYGSFQLKEISFTLQQGCMMGLIGENGAGKSTTLKLLLNLIKRDSGEISLLGLDPEKEERKIKEQIGVVFDENFFHDVLRAKDIPSIMRPIYSNWDDRLYASLCTRFQLSSEKKIREYSRGMKMKLAIAAAMAHHPRLLLLDEATSGLDPVVRNEMLDLFQEFIQDERNSILLSTHITSDLERVADYITFLHQGRVLMSESKDELLLSHRVLRCGAERFAFIDQSRVIGLRKSGVGVEALVKPDPTRPHDYDGCVLDPATLEDIMLFSIKGEGSVAKYNILQQDPGKTI